MHKLDFLLSYFERKSEADLEVRQTTAYESKTAIIFWERLKAIFSLLHRCSTYLKSASGNFTYYIKL